MFESDYADDLLLEEGDETAAVSEETEVAEKIAGVPIKGQRINELYSLYAADPSEVNLNSLLTDLGVYAERILTQAGFGLRLDIKEAAQTGVIKVWHNLSKFQGKSKFSSWAHRVIKNTALDEIRKINRRAESELSHDDKGDVLTYYGTLDQHCFKGASGNVEKDPNDDDEVGAGERLHIVSEPPSYVRTGDDDNTFVNSVRIEATLTLAEEILNAKDFELLGYYLEGYSPDSIGFYFQKNAKWASNQLTRIKNALKKATQAKSEERTS